MNDLDTQSTFRALSHDWIINSSLAQRLCPQAKIAKSGDTDHQGEGLHICGYNL